MKKQLLNEFDWVESTRSLITNLQYPFVVDQQSQPLNVEDVYNEISADREATAHQGHQLRLPDDVPGRHRPRRGRGLRGRLRRRRQGAGTGRGRRGVRSDTTSEADGDSTDTLHDEVDDLDHQLADQQVSYVEALDQLGAILVSDAGKLQTVGVSVGTDPAWSWSEGTTLSESITALNATSRAYSYAALLPPTWGVWNLKGYGQSPPTANDVKTY